MTPENKILRLEQIIKKNFDNFLEVHASEKKEKVEDRIWRNSGSFIVELQ